MVTRCLRPGLAEETTGPPKFLENPNCPFAHDPSDSGRTADTRPSRCSSVAPGQSTTKAPAKGLSKLNSMAFGLAVYASQCALPRPTQDSLPAAGQALPDGLSTRKVPMKGFRFASYISSPFPKLLGAMIATEADWTIPKLASVLSTGSNSRHGWAVAERCCFCHQVDHGGRIWQCENELDSSCLRNPSRSRVPRSR